MNLEQLYIPDFSYCIVCGTPTKKETCSEKCESTLDFLRVTVKEKTEAEKTGTKNWDEHNIGAFNNLQEKIG